jgi:hypothetical protein
MLLRVNKSQEALLKKVMKSLPCTVMSGVDFAIVIDVDDDEIEEFMNIADDFGIDVDEFDETPQGRPKPRPEPRPMGGGEQWRELI